MSALTLQNARDAFSSDKQDLSDVSQPLFVRWCQLIVNFLYLEMIGVEPEQFIQSHTFSGITSGAQNLPANFFSLKEDGTGVFLVDANGNLTTKKLSKTGPGQTARGFYISGGRIYFTGITTAETFIMRFTPSPPAFSSMSDYITMDKLSTGKIIVDSLFLETLLKALDVHYEYWDQNVNAEVSADQRYVRLMDVLVQNFAAESGTYAFEDSSSAF